MKKTFLFTLFLIGFVGNSLGSSVTTDTFGIGVNQFQLDFSTISSDTNPIDDYGYVSYDYRMGLYEITNLQWEKFQNSYGPVTGSPPEAYNAGKVWVGDDKPTNRVSWYEAAQFINYLNTSKGFQVAYKFIGTQGTEDYTFTLWEPADPGYNSSNPFRNSNAFYFIPTENEWVKAAYWNGTNLQTYATPTDTEPIAGVNSNYLSILSQPWYVGSGSEELNGTFDMMGNVWEWTETTNGSNNIIRGGQYNSLIDNLLSTNRYDVDPFTEAGYTGFRVASFPACPSADITGDCFVDLEDLAALASQWLTGVQERP